jgi:hypothetical protein
MKARKADGMVNCKTKQRWGAETCQTPTAIGWLGASLFPGDQAQSMGLQGGGVAAKDRREPATEGAVAQRARLVGEEGLLNAKWWTSSYGCVGVKKKQRQGWRADLGGRGDCFDSGVVGSERGGWRAHSPIL